MRQTIHALVTASLERLSTRGILPVPPPLSNIKVERPREKGHGDFSTNAAMALAKTAKMPPRDLANLIVAALNDKQGIIARCEVAGPGFINFHVSRKRMVQLVADILAQGGRFGHSQMGGGQRVQVEFVSANPTGPMHVGHGRGAAVGDVIARLLAATGHVVEREYYINDAGVQMAVLGRSLLLRYRESFGQEIEFPKDAYPGDYVRELAAALRERDGDAWLGASAEEPPQAVIDFAIEQVMGWIREDLDRLAIRFDQFFSERTLHASGAIDRALDVLSAKELIYQGVLTPPKGKLPDDWEPRPQRLFSSTRFGDEVDRPLQKSDGSYTYFAADVAYHYHKVTRGFAALIDVWGADHGGYIKRVQAALQALTGRKGMLDVKLVQMVNLTRGGQPVRMSKRAGNFVTLREVVEEVGADAVRFWFLSRAASSQLDFDLELAVSQSNDNPVYYVQYAHARVCSVWEKVRKANTQRLIHRVKAKPVGRHGMGFIAVPSGLSPSPETIHQADLSALEEEAEFDLIRAMDRFPDTVEAAALSRDPHLVTYYLLDLASQFHTYYNGHRILQEEPDARQWARLALITAVRQVLRNGLDILGVTAPERM